MGRKKVPAYRFLRKPVEYRIETRGYRRRLSQSLDTAGGAWSSRDGIVVRLEDADGRVGYGEVAPMRRAGSESIPRARRALRELGAKATDEALDALPRDLPCCRFALISARWMINEPDLEYSFANCALLPAAERAILGLERAVDSGYRSFKLKIGVIDTQTEQAVVDQLLDGLPQDGRLRLDANGAFDAATARVWLEFLKGRAGVDFIEQPLPVGAEEEAAEIANEFQTQVALDESVSAPGQLVTLVSARVWKGPLALKPLLLGDPLALPRMLAPLNNRMVVSSVFETGFGIHNALRLADAIGVNDAVGFGTLSFFDDGLGGFAAGPKLSSVDAVPHRLAELWQVLKSR